MAFARAAALYGEITFKDGRVEQTNFGDYRVLRINEAPRIDVTIVASPTIADSQVTQNAGFLAQAQLDEAKSNLADLQAGPSKDDVTIAQTRLDQANAALNQAILTAPFAGTITDIQILTGDLVSPGTTAFRIDDLSSMYVDLQVSEVDIQQIQVGQQAAQDNLHIQVLQAVAQEKQGGDKDEKKNQPGLPPRVLCAFRGHCLMPPRGRLPHRASDPMRLGASPGHSSYGSNPFP